MLHSKIKSLQDKAQFRLHLQNISERSLTFYIAES